LTALLFIVAAAGIRFYHLGDQSLWNDELFSLQVASLRLSEIQPALAANYHHPPLFFYLLHFVVGFFGATAWSLRVISAIAGCATVGLVCFYGSRMFGFRGGVAAAAICLVAPFHIAYSQEGRPYALAALLALASCCVLFEILKAPGRRLVASYVILTAALLYTHHWGIFVLGAQTLYLLLGKEDVWSRKKPVLIALVIVGGLYLPELPSLFRQSAGGSSSGWFWVEGPSWREWYRLAGAFSGTYFKMASAVFESPPALGWLSSCVLVALAASALVESSRRHASPSLRFLASCSLGTLLIPFTLSFAKPEIFLWYRYTVIAFPLFCLLLGAASATGRWKRWRIPAAAILLAAGLIGDVHYFSWQKANAREVAGCVDSLTSGGVNILIRPASFAPLLNYYYGGNAAQLDETYLDHPLGGIVDTASAFIYVSLDVPNSIRDYMDGHFLRTFERRFPGEAHMGIIVAEYRQRPEN
jgi:4-amino-4-deoxy-L-arabinose transferase-like glycosyltransferase